MRTVLEGSGAAADIPALPRHCLTTYFFQTANVLTPRHPRRLSRFLSERGCRGEKWTGQSNNQPNAKQLFLPAHQCFPVRLVCVSVPTDELMLTFRFNNTLTLELTALMLTSEVRFCCAVAFNVIDPWLVLDDVGEDNTDNVPAPVTRPFLVGTDPWNLMTPFESPAVIPLPSHDP